MSTNEHFRIDPLLLARLRASRLDRYKAALLPKTKALLRTGKATADEVLRTLAEEVLMNPALANNLPAAITLMLNAWKREQKAKG